MLRSPATTGLALALAATSACFSPTGSDTDPTATTTASTSSASTTDVTGAPTTSSSTAEPTSTTAVTTDATGPATTLEPSTGVASTATSSGTTMSAESCTDTVQNGDESDVDCGGSCPPCANDEMCQENADCVSQACQGNICVAPACMDVAGCPAPLACHAVDCVDFACQDTPLDGVVCDDGRVCTHDDHCATGTCVASTPKPISLADVAVDPTLGLHFDGVPTNIWAGNQVSYGGDVNGDGIADLLISAERLNTTPPKLYVVFGGPTLATATLAGVAAGTGGFVVKIDSFNSPVSIAAAGDVNGDKRGDLVIGLQSFLNIDGSGAVYVVFGKNGDTAPIKLSALANNGILLVGPKVSNTALGASVAGIGDVNGDMRMDFAVGAPAYKISNVALGAAYIVYGQANLANGSIDTVVAQGGAVRLEGPATTTDFGRVVGSVGDFNKDGRIDLAVGQPNQNMTTGRVVVVYLPQGPLPTTISVPDAPMPTQGLVLTIVGPSSKLGNALGPAGDFNDDGAADLLVGSGPVLNKAFVVHGGLIGGTLDIGKLVTDKKGFILTGNVSENFGASVWGGLDVNGDNVSDIVVGAPNANAGSGRAYVAFGRDTPAAITAADLAQGKGGFAIDGQNLDQAGGSVGLMPDLNGDARNEILVGARQYDVTPMNENAGRAYIVYGGDCQP